MSHGVARATRWDWAGAREPGDVSARPQRVDSDALEEATAKDA